MALQKILIAGYGTMAGAMVDGWLAAGIDPARFAIYHPRMAKAPHGLALYNEWPHEPFDGVLLAVKPQKLGEVTSGLEPLVGAQTVLISVLAGVNIAGLAERFPRAGAIVRITPNLAAALGKSPNVLVAQGLDDVQRTELTSLAAALGSAEWLADESQLDLVTALVGSGPAFVYRFIDGFAEGAADLGLEREQASRLALAMVEGAAALAATSDHPPGDLANRVASPGGMTREGLNVLDEDSALQEILTRCLRAARDRAEELAEFGRKDG